MDDLYFLLGLPPDVPWSEVAAAYERLVQSLAEDDLCDDCDLPRAMRSARERLGQWRQQAQRCAPPHDLEMPQADSGWDSLDRGHCRPKLGQLLVAAGLLSLEELYAVLEIQRNTGHEHIPIGELLVELEYITERQKDYYLRLREAVKLPADHPQRWGQSLLALGLIDEDQLKVALIEQQQTGCTLRQALINRGFLTEKALDRIF